MPVDNQDRGKGYMVLRVVGIVALCIVLYAISVFYGAWWLVSSLVEVEFERLGEGAQATISTPWGTTSVPPLEEIEGTIRVPIYPGSLNVERIGSSHVRFDGSVPVSSVAYSLLTYEATEEFSEVLAWYKTSLSAEFAPWKSVGRVRLDVALCGEELYRHEKKHIGAAFVTNGTARSQYVGLIPIDSGARTKILVLDCLFQGEAGQ